jgi:hypothetical protein
VHYHCQFEGGLTVGKVRVDFGHVDTTNRANLDKTQNKKTVNYIAAKQLVLVGPGHKQEHIDAVNKDLVAFKCSGKIQVNKGDILGIDKGELIVSGARNQSEFDSCLRRITKKKITHRG